MTRSLRILMTHLFGRFPRLHAVWCLARGYPVAYRLRIENGGLVIDGRKPCSVNQVTVIGAAAGMTVHHVEPGDVRFT